VRWTVLGYEPKIATADGGVIAQAYDPATGDYTGAAVTFDQNGNATGQMASLPTYSWTESAYQVGSVEQIFTNIINRAISWWPTSGGNSSGNGTASRPVSQDVQQLIAQIARGYTNSPQNATWENKPGYQCNAFVQQVLNDANAQAPLSLSTRFKNSFPRIAYYLGASTKSYPASAGDWAFPHNTMTCWRNVEPSESVFGHLLPADVSMPGDVIAESILSYGDATGHVGIVAGFQQTVSADSAAYCTSEGTKPAEIIDITNYGVRPDGWKVLSPTGQVCSTYGWKSNAVVKRFVCQ
jgi:hypothetical protein